MCVSSVKDVLFGRKGNVLGIYLRMSVVVALGSFLVQVTHTESGPAFAVGGQGHWTLGRTGENQSKEWSVNRGARCVHKWVPPACMTRDNWACPRVITLVKIYFLFPFTPLAGEVCYLRLPCFSLKRAAPVGDVGNRPWR